MTADLSLINGLGMIYENDPFITSLRKTAEEFSGANWGDAFSRGQIESKKWLIHELRAALDERSYLYEWFPARAYICASWYGILAELLLREFGSKVSRIRCFDSDPEAVLVANRLLRHWHENWRVKTVLLDIHELNFQRDSFRIMKHNGELVDKQDTPDTIINTSCEHIEGFSGWYAKIPEGKLVVMQSNDYFDLPEHVNCYRTLDDFAADTPMSEEFFSGELEFDLYTRWMRIGRR